ncbi:SLAIN motif-containing protein 2-like isoform X2 [Antedon mediterranea]|uniref:SLAIN motif-containing protein 2-like isoform X2 n=1 Tax=Antedon mediterranea TaxID=105859 RepID=UPI003AF7D965
MGANVDPEIEVKKLQDLVKKLEKQNELLRSKANSIVTPELGRGKNGSSSLINDADTNAHVGLGLNNSSPVGGSPVHSSNSNGKVDLNSSLDSVKTIDFHLHPIDCEEDEDSWLYMSPVKVPTPEQRLLSPEKWVRKDFDNPSREMESAKKSLQAKLDEVSRAKRNSFGRPSALRRNSNGLDLDNCNSANSEQSSTGNSPPLSPPSTSANTTPRRRSEDRRMEERRRSEDGLAKLEDVTDVQILAKMQEDSLRKATQNSPANTPRRPTSVSPASSENSLVSLPRAKSGSETQLNRSEYENESGKVVLRRRASLEKVRKCDGDVRRYSFGSRVQNFSAFDNGGEGLSLSDLQKLALGRNEGHGGSMPNLNRSFNSSPSGSPRAHNGHEGRLKQPGTIPVNRSMTPPKGGLKPPSPSKGRSLSPQGKGIPIRAIGSEMTASRGSGIPKPRLMGSSTIPRSKIATPNKRAIPASRSYYKTKDESWKDGCF